MKLSDSFLPGLKGKLKEKITEYTQEIIKKAVIPLIAENEALKDNNREKDEEIEDLQTESDVWMWVAIGSLAAAGIGWICFALK